jgi:hypothetical protein
MKFKHWLERNEEYYVEWKVQVLFEPDLESIREKILKMGWKIVGQYGNTINLTGPKKRKIIEEELCFRLVTNQKTGEIVEVPISKRNCHIDVSFVDRRGDQLQAASVNRGTEIISG